MGSPITELVLLPLKPDSDIENPESESGKTWASLVATLNEQKGFQGLYYGRSLEKPTYLQFAADWTTLQDHITFTETPSSYTPFLHKFLSLLTTEPFEIHHAHFPSTTNTTTTTTTTSTSISAHTTTTTSPSFRTIAAQQAPVVEMLTAYLDASAAEADFEAAWKTFTAEALEGAEGYVGQTSGWILERVRHSSLSSLGLVGRGGSTSSGGQEGEGEEGEEVEVEGKAWIGVIGWECVEAHEAARETEGFKGAIGAMMEAARGFDMYHVKYTTAS